LSGEVSPLGEVTLQSVEAETSHDQVLSSCLQAALYGLQAQTVTPRRTLFDLRIYFGHSSTNPPVQPLKPAPLEDVPRVPACVEALDPLPVDHLAAKEPLEAFDDAASESRPSEFRPSGPIHAPHYLPWTLAHNLGAYRACYRTALQSQPTLSGRIVIHGRIDRDGRISAKLKESSVASESLRECLLQAVAEVWVHPWPQPLRRNEAVEFDYPLQLTLRPAQTEPPEPPAKTLLPAERSADDFFDAQDDVNALRGYSALLRWQPQHRHALYWQKMEVLALYMAQPWRLLELSGDAVMMPLLSSLQRLSARGWVRRREPLRAMEVLDEFATQPHSDGSSLLLYPLIERAAARYALIASLGLTRPMDYLQHFLWAEALFKLGRYCEAAPVYKQVVAWPDDRKRKDAAYAAIVPWRNCLELEWLTTDSDARLIVPPRPTALDRRLIQAFEDYRRVAPEDTDSFRWFAEALLYHGQCAAAQSVAQELEQRLPGSEKAKSLRDHVLFQCRQQKTDGIPLSVSMH